MCFDPLEWPNEFLTVVATSYSPYPSTCLSLASVVKHVHYTQIAWLLFQLRLAYYLITCIYVKIIFYLTSWGFTQLVASNDHSITLLMLGVVFSVDTLIDGSKEFGEVVI